MSKDPLPVERTAVWNAPNQLGDLTTAARQQNKWMGKQSSVTLTPIDGYNRRSKWLSTTVIKDISFKPAPYLSRNACLWLHYLSFPPPRNSCLIPCLVLPKTSFKVCCPHGQVQLCSISSFGNYHLWVFTNWLKGASLHHSKPKLIQVICAVRNMTDTFQKLTGICLWRNYHHRASTQSD